jgi:hypothetical protein
MDCNSELDGELLQNANNPHAPSVVHARHNARNHVRCVVGLQLDGQRSHTALQNESARFGAMRAVAVDLGPRTRLTVFRQRVIDAALGAQARSVGA